MTRRNITLAPGQPGAIAQAAASNGESGQQFISRAIDDAIERRIYAQLRMGRITQAEAERQLSVVRMTYAEARAKMLRAEMPLDHDIDKRQQHR